VQTIIAPLESPDASGDVFNTGPDDEVSPDDEISMWELAPSFVEGTNITSSVELVS
jgi:hypothetical protein